MKANFAYVVVEDNAGANTLKRLLPRTLAGKTRFVIADAKGSAVSDARTILVLKKRPLALVVDADANDESSVKERRETLRQLLRNVAPGVACEAFVAVPTVEELARKGAAVDKIALVEELSAFLKSASS